MKEGRAKTGSYIGGVEGEDFLHALVIFFGGNELRDLRWRQQKSFSNAIWSLLYSQKYTVVSERGPHCEITQHNIVLEVY